MVKRIALALLLFGSLVALALPASAGGWASVRVLSQEVDPENPGTWTITVVVLQHDVTPFEADTLTVHFVNAKSGATINATGVPTGKTGEFRFDVVFPEGGSWAWTATPAPFAPFNMESLDVAEISNAGLSYSLQGMIWRGSCLSQQGLIQSFPLVHSAGKDGAIVDVGIIPAFDIVVDQAAGKSLALTVYGDVAGETIKKCRNLRILDASSPVTVPQDVVGDSSSNETWTLLPGEGGSDATFVTVFRPVVNNVTVEITEMGGGAFDPPSLTVPAGTTVTWVNKTTISHTVSGVDPTFASSGILDPGQLFSQTFSVPGTYHYACDPHNWMTGTVTVTG